jgi:hypothetical protein
MRPANETRRRPVKRRVKRRATVPGERAERRARRNALRAMLPPLIAALAYVDYTAVVWPAGRRPTSENVDAFEDLALSIPGLGVRRRVRHVTGILHALLTFTAPAPGTRPAQHAPHGGRYLDILAEGAADTLQSIAAALEPRSRRPTPRELRGPGKVDGPPDDPRPAA